MSRPSVDYEPRHPAGSTLYRIVRDHVETFRVRAASAREGEGLPGFVEEEFHAFLGCGWLAARHQGDRDRLECEIPLEVVIAVDDQGMTVQHVVDQHRPERFARGDITEVRAYPGRAGTFMGGFGALFAVGGALAGIVAGGMLGHRQLARHKGLGAALGAGGGYMAGLATGFGIMAMGGAFREDVIYRAP